MLTSVFVSAVYRIAYVIAERRFRWWRCWSQLSCSDFDINHLTLRPIFCSLYRYISKRVSLSPSRGIVFHVVSLSRCLSVRGMVLKVTGRIVTKFYWMCGSRVRQNPIILGMIWMVLRVCHPECILVALTDIFCCRSAEGASKERDKHLFGDSRGRRSILEIAHLSYSCFYIHIHHWRRYVLYGVLFYFVYSFFLDDKY